MDVRADLEAIFRAGVAACHPGRIVPPCLPPPPPGRTILLALGKAGAAMARAVEENWTSPLSGVAVVPHGQAEPRSKIEFMEAGHPIPDEASVAASERLLSLAKSAGPDDLVFVLLSGGASSLACLPSEGLTLEEKRVLTGSLLRSGASIGEVNCVRRHLSAIKGGRLARAAHPARIVTLAISDVPGDRAADIGSGPTAADPTGVYEAITILDRYGIGPPASGWTESAKPAEAEGWRAEYQMIANGMTALEAAGEEARRLGWDPILIDPEARGEAREVARLHAEEAMRIGRRAALLSGGELTVTVAGLGRGGRNREYALALAMALRGARGISALAADTDGIDGSPDAAGAFIDADTLGRARGLGLDPEAALRENDSGGFFSALSDAFVTGPTGTNVSDLRIILVEG